MKNLPGLLLLLCVCCTPATRPLPVKISLIDNGRSTKIIGLDYAVISELTRNSANWQALIPVYRMPADTSLKSYQPVQPGVYTMKDSTLVFTPDTPFIKGTSYFARYYRFDKNAQITDFVKGKRKLGSTTYTDLIFKQ